MEVQASDVRVEMQQSELKGVLTSAQIENLPINGRDFVDFAQLEPGPSFGVQPSDLSSAGGHTRAKQEDIFRAHTI